MENKMISENVAHDRMMMAAKTARSDMADKLKKHCKSYASEFKGEKSEYASGFRRAMRIAEKAADAIAQGKTFNEQDEVWE